MEAISKADEICTDTQTKEHCMLNIGQVRPKKELSDAQFADRHMGYTEHSVDQQEMLNRLGYAALDDFVADVIPPSIRLDSAMDLPEALDEYSALEQLRGIAKKNSVYKSFIGQGYYGTHTPGVIQRNILENPAWYTAYTPYQPEISQGRLEALLNFQTMLSDLTGLPVANASMLDEGTAAAEAMALARRASKNKANTFFIDQDCLPQTIEVVKTRAAAAGIDIIVGDPLQAVNAEDYFGFLLQYPGCSGQLRDFTALIASVHAGKGIVCMAADILSLLLLKSPGELGADVAIGSTQRFGVPMGFGGPHAAYMATQTKYQRSLPGRLVGVSVDAQGNSAYRLALQTREQHIRREKATSNICTAQVLLAVIASMYAVYHGPDGLRAIAARVHAFAAIFARQYQAAGGRIQFNQFFDTLTLSTGNKTAEILQRAEQAKINLRVVDHNTLSVAFDETTTLEDFIGLLEVFGLSSVEPEALLAELSQVSPESSSFLQGFLRADLVLQHPVFSSYRSETEMLRYLRRLSDKDLALDRTMIPLGSCTMKLNATSEMLPIGWPEFSSIHPFAPADQVSGYLQMIAELEQMLVECTGYDAVSIQPNAGSQGEFAGLLAIKGYHESRNESHRDICLIPSSAHGTNPASAQMCSMQVVVVGCDEDGNIDIDDLREKAERYSENLAAIMITYPSTHGVFEEQITDVTAIVHQHGGQVYVDGANLNAMVGLTGPGYFGGDVSHLNLHKTFCIPHGGGGPGVGPVAAKAHLAPFLPRMASDYDASQIEQADNDRPVISAAPFGSASILPISWMYIAMMGPAGLKRATQVAILSANYIAARLGDAFPVLYKGERGLVAHECILDLRDIKEQTGVSVDDVAKRLIDYGFHAPTMSFPVAGTLMIEPTESESKAELDRFCDAMLSIRAEIARVANGEWRLQDNPLVNAPHTAEYCLQENWPHSYSRALAAYPYEGARQDKYFPPVARIDNAHGDRNLICSCPPLDEYVA